MELQTQNFPVRIDEGEALSQVPDQPVIIRQQTVKLQSKTLTRDQEVVAMLMSVKEKR